MVIASFGVSVVSDWPQNDCEIMLQATADTCTYNNVKELRIFQ